MWPNCSEMMMVISPPEYETPHQHRPSWRPPSDYCHLSVLRAPFAIEEKEWQGEAGCRGRHLKWNDREGSFGSGPRSKSSCVQCCHCRQDFLDLHCVSKSHCPSRQSWPRIPTAESGVLQIDIKNAFKSVHRSSILDAVGRQADHLLPWTQQSLQSSTLSWGSTPW
jgi:hypothetical protein